MKPSARLRLFLCLAGGSIPAFSYVSAQTTLYWDGGTTNIAADGNGASAGGNGTWSTSIQNWDQGIAAHVAWDNTAPFDTAVLGGTAGTVSLGTAISVGTIQIQTAGYGINPNGNVLSVNAISAAGGGTSSFSAAGTVDITGGLSVSTATASDRFTFAQEGSTNSVRITLNGGADATTLSGPGYINFRLVANNTTGGITINDGATALINNGLTASLGTNNLTINGGVVQVYTASGITRALGTGASQIQITGGVSGFTAAGNVNFNNSAATEVVWGSAVFNPETFILESGSTLSNNVDLGGVTRTVSSRSGTGTMSGLIRTTSGTAGLTKTGAGELVLSNTGNSYDGTTTVSQGILTANTTTALPGFSTSGRVSVADGATIAVRTGAWTSANIDSLRGAATWAAAGSRLGINTTTGNFTYNSDITEAISVSKLGTNALTLGGNNSYSGATIIAGGTLEAASTTALSTGDINFTGGTLQFTAATASTDWTTRFKNSTGAVSINTNSQNVTLAGNIASSNTGGLTKAGAGTLTLSGTNAYTGATTVSGGILRAGAAAGGQAFGSNSAVTLANTAGVALDLNDFDQTIGSLAGGGTTGGNVTLGSATLTLGGDNTSTTFAGNITGTGGLIKNGTGALTLSGTTTDYSGGFTLNAGSVGMPSSGAYTKFGTGVVTINGGQFANAIGASQTFANDMVWNAGFSVSQSSAPIFNGNITLGGNSGITPGTTTRSISATFNGNIGETGGSRSLTFSGVGVIGHTLTFNGQNTFTGNLTGHSGTAVVIGGSGYLGGGNYAGNISVGSLTYGSSAHQILSGSVSLTGGSNTNVLYINNGTLQLAKQVSLHNNNTGNWTAAKINVKSGATLALNVGGTGEFTTGNVTTLLTNLAASSSSTNGMNDGSNFGFDTTNAAGGSFTIANVIADSTGTSGGARGLTKLGTGTLELTNTSTYTGATNVNGGILKLGADNVLPDTSPVSIGTATLDADIRTDLAGTLDVTGSAVINLASGAALAFADSSAVDWTGGTLNITGTLEATSLRFGTTSGGLTGGPTGQLALISVNGSGLGTYTLDADGYLVPGGAGSAYDTWATAKGLTGAAGSSTDPAKAADPDGDGKNNLYEFAFDGNPLSGAYDGKIVGKVATIGTDQVMTLTLPVRTGAIFSPSSGDQLSALIDGIYYRVEGDVNLSTFANTITEVTGGDAAAIQAGLPALSTGWAYRTFRDSGTVSTVPKAFLRAKVSETP